MDFKFFIIFAAATIVFEIVISMLLLVPKARKYRGKDYSDIQTQINASLVWERTKYDRKRRCWTYYNKYKWEYNGKKHHAVFHNASPSKTMMITINQKTGRYQFPKAEGKVDRLIILGFLVSVILGYIIACMICGYNPLFS